MKQRSAVFWVLLVAGGSCALCTLATMAVLLLGWVSTSDPGGTSPRGVVAASGALPTGETPDLYPGSMGWLPSGRGVPFPEAELVDERPQGLWWVFSLLSDGKTWGADVNLFLPDGTYALRPRPGGGLLFDLEGQRAGNRFNSSTHVGTFEVADGKLTILVDGYTRGGPFESGSDGEGPYFKVNNNKYLPLTPPAPGLLVGNWKSPSGKFIFRADGSFEMGNVLFTEGYVIAAGNQGRYQLEGHLLQLQPPGQPSWISFVGMTGENFLIIDQTVYSRL